MILRKATVNDIELLIRLRIDYLTEDAAEYGKTFTQEEKTSIRLQLEEYLPKHISDNTFIGIFAEIDGNAVSTAYLAISQKPANTLFITGISGTLLNVLTYPEYRRKGIATKVISKIIEEAKEVGVSHIELSASTDGMPLYKKIGFKESSYTTMGIKLIDAD